MGNTVLVAGVGMVPFRKPGESDPYYVMGGNAARAALEDAGLTYKDVEQAFVGYVLGNSTEGQAALYGLGETGIPITNVSNNCGSGSTALFHARQVVQAGLADVAIALGFEEMPPGALTIPFPNRASPFKRHLAEMAKVQAPSDAPLAAQIFAAAHREYSERYGTSPEVFAKVAVKARKHAVNNPFAVFRDPVTVQEVLSSRHIYGSLTLLQCCPPTCGAAAAVLVSGTYAKKKGLRVPVKISGQSMTTDFPSTFDSHSMIKVVGYDLTQSAADRVYEQSGIGPTEVSVVELHDCFTTNEILSYEALRLTPPGEAEKFIEDDDNTYGGRTVVNPSGGLLSKGHPLGATGLAQCAELVWQLRGSAGQRQVEGARHALQHNAGLGGACIVTMYSRA